MKGNNMGTQNLIMVDFAAKDTRSVSAMLRGNGDGRELAYQKFIDTEILKEPILSEAELAEIYSRQSRAEYFRERRTLRPGEFWNRITLPFLSPRHAR